VETKKPKRSDPFHPLPRGASAAFSRLAAAARVRPHVPALLQLIWEEGDISRAELAKRTGLSRSTVSEIVGELLATHLVAEVGTGESQGGRRPIVLRFQYDGFGIVGIDMGATHVGVAVTNLRGEVSSWEERSHPVREDPRGTQALVFELVERSLRRAGQDLKRLLAIGLAVPSPVDPRRPDHLSEVVMPAWAGRSLVKPLHDRFQLPVVVDNDANLGALAEHWWGAGRGVDDSVYIKVATGVGSGHIIGGRIYRGASGTAGEIGHLAIDTQGPVCICGLRGCLATFIGTPALVARTLTLLPKHPRSLLAHKKIDITAIEDAALAGDPLGLQVVEEAADRLGIAVAGMLNLMNPAVVAIGGSLARLGELLIRPLRESVRRRSWVSSVAATKIVASELGVRNVAVGASTLVLQNALEDLRFFPTGTARHGRPHA